MKYEWIDSFCISLKGTVHDFKEEWEADRYMLAGKIYAMIGTHPDGRKIITLKGEPADTLQLRDRFKDIIAGYHMNKLHWNSVYLDGGVPDKVVKQMIVSSHGLVFLSLSKKAQLGL